MKEPVKFGNYHLFERIAVGGMAEVFRAASYGVEAFERVFALKRVLPHIAEDQEFIDMFIDEAKIAVQLAHANIGQLESCDDNFSSHSSLLSSYFLEDRKSLIGCEKGEILLTVD